MSTTSTVAETGEVAPEINPLHLVFYACAFLVMVLAIWSGVPWFLNFVHVMAGVLWTGIDLFMGFYIGPVLRAAPFEARRAVIVRLMPKTLFLMPTLSIITGTSGWFHARQLGFLDVPWPQYGWVLAALVIITVLTLQGLGILLPTNLRVYLELRRPIPDRDRISRLMRTYVYWVTVQGCMQVAIIVVMARFVTGL